MINLVKRRLQCFNVTSILLKIFSANLVFCGSICSKFICLGIAGKLFGGLNASDQSHFIFILWLHPLSQQPLECPHSSRGPNWYEINQIHLHVARYGTIFFGMKEELESWTYEINRNFWCLRCAIVFIHLNYYYYIRESYSIQLF